MNSGLRYTAFLAALIILFTATLLLPGKLLITAHIGDVLHVLDAGFRMAEGEIPHQDFMTPIGIFAFAPIALFLSLGFGPAASMVLANTFAALLLLPAIAFVGNRRLDGLQKYAFGAVVVIMTMAMIYGGVEAWTSYSMHYNRWAWAVTFIVLAAMIFPLRSGNPDNLGDILVIGFGLSILAMLKITFFLAFGAATLLILLVTKRYKTIAGVAIIGAAVVGILTAFLGLDFWFAYADDLLLVANAQVRIDPDRSLFEVLSNPDRVLGVIALLFSIIFFRMSSLKQQGLILLILTPPFVYVVHQNWGNDLKWLFLLGLYFAVFLPNLANKQFFGVNAAKVSGIFSVVIFTLFAPTIVAMGTSIFRASIFETKEYQIVPYTVVESDLWALGTPFADMAVKNFIPGAENPDTIEKPDNGTPFQHVFNDEELPVCSIMLDILGNMAVTIQHLEQFPETHGKQVLIADFLNALWMFADYERLTNGAPWYYHGDAGQQQAEYYFVPLCPSGPQFRSESNRAMEQTGWQLEEVGRTSMFILFKINK